MAADAPNPMQGPQPAAEDPRAASAHRMLAQKKFLQVFLASEQEIYRYVAAIAPARGDADEIVQQTAVEMWRKFDQFDLSRPFTPLACRFALNVARQWLARKQRWQAAVGADVIDRIADRRVELLPRMDSRLRHLEGCLDKLPVDQRRIIDGYYFRRLSIEAVATEAGRSVTAAYKALQRIRQALEACIERAEGLEASP